MLCLLSSEHHDKPVAVGGKPSSGALFGVSQGPRQAGGNTCNRAGLLCPCPVLLGNRHRPRGQGPCQRQKCLHVAKGRSGPRKVCEVELLMQGFRGRNRRMELPSSIPRSGRLHRQRQEISSFLGNPRLALVPTGGHGTPPHAAAKPTCPAQAGALVLTPLPIRPPSTPSHQTVRTTATQPRGRGSLRCSLIEPLRPFRERASVSCPVKPSFLKSSGDYATDLPLLPTHPRSSGESSCLMLWAALEARGRPGSVCALRKAPARAPENGHDSLSRVWLAPPARSPKVVNTTPSSTWTDPS